MLRYLFLCVLSAGLALAAWSEERIALLIGNADYSEAVGALDNPHNDVLHVRDALLAAGFDEDKIRIVTDANRRTMLREIRNFRDRAANLLEKDSAFFYYSGHGAKKPDRPGTALIPVGIDDVSTEDFWFDTINLENDVIKMFEEAPGQPVWLIAIDACRNELKLPRRALGGGDKGFGFIPQAGGMLIAFAADQGETARDAVNSSTTSPFATALAEEIIVPGRQVSAAFGAIRPRVKELTSDAQEPVVTNKLNFDPIWKLGDMVVNMDDDEADWGRLSQSGEKDDYEAYLRLHPRGKYADEAQARIDQINMMAPEITGRWAGSYYYSDGRSPVEFSVQINEADGVVSGLMREPNTFGSAASRNLYADIRGSLTGRNLTYVKTYDGSGGQSHSVTYAGIVSEDGTTIEGSWNIGSLFGKFYIEKQ